MVTHKYQNSHLSHSGFILVILQKKSLRNKETKNYLLVAIIKSLRDKFNT